MFVSKYKLVIAKTILVFFLFLFSSIGTIFSQGSFELLISNETDEVPNPLIEIDGNIITSIFNHQYAHLIKINNEGEIIDSIDISNGKGPCYISEFVLNEDNSIIALGGYQVDTLNYLFFLKMDSYFGIIDSIMISVPGKILNNYINATLNAKGNIVVCASYETQNNNDFDIFIMEIEQNGNITKENYWGDPNSMKIVYDIEEHGNGKYYITTNTFDLEAKSTCYIYEIDSNLNITNQGIDNWDTGNLNDLEFLNDSVFILSGVKHIYNIEKPQMGLLKMDLNYNIIDSIHFGKLIDTADYPGFSNNLDFISTNILFYGGTTNIDIYNPFFSTYISWFMLNKLDSDLNPIWQRYYGGDAYYTLWSILATQDGGCVLAGTRYDYLTQGYERDVYILKVNEDGLITWAHNVPEVTRQVLVYPNPGSDVINIKTIENGITFELYDERGNKPIKKVLVDGNTIVNTGFLSPGIYVYRVLDVKGKVVETGKWIKQ